MCTCTHFLGLFDVFSIFIYIRSFLFGFLKIFLGIHVELFFLAVRDNCYNYRKLDFFGIHDDNFLNSLYH